MTNPMTPERFQEIEKKIEYLQNQPGKLDVVFKEDGTQLSWGVQAVNDILELAWAAKDLVAEINRLKRETNDRTEKLWNAVKRSSLCGVVPYKPPYPEVWEE